MAAFIERRKYERFSVNSLSCILISPMMVLSYGISDISDYGLAFSYSSHSDWENWPQKGLRLDIIDKNFYLEDIPFELIENMRLDDGTKEYRRCGVKFTGLKADQEAMLRQYVKYLSTH